MGVLTPDELAALRRAVSDSIVPVTWDKPTINAALQDTEDVLEAQAFDASTLVAVANTTSTRAQNVKTALDEGQIAANLVPVVEDWLVEHPPSESTRSVDATGIASFVTANRPSFAAAVAAMPLAQRAKVVRLIVRRWVEAVV